MTNSLYLTNDIKGHKYENTPGKSVVVMNMMVIMMLMPTTMRWFQLWFGGDANIASLANITNSILQLSLCENQNLNYFPPNHYLSLINPHFPRRPYRRPPVEANIYLSYADYPPNVNDVSHSINDPWKLENDKGTDGDWWWWWWFYIRHSRGYGVFILNIWNSDQVFKAQVQKTPIFASFFAEQEST